MNISVPKGTKLGAYIHISTDEGEKFIRVGNVIVWRPIGNNNTVTEMQIELHHLPVIDGRIYIRQES